MAKSRREIEKRGADRTNRGLANPSGEPALTVGEQRAIEVLANTTNAGKPVADLARLAGVSAQTFRAMRGRDSFQRAFHDLLLRRLNGYLPILLEQAVESAKLLGRDGHNDRRMLFAMAGLIQPTGRDASQDRANAAAAGLADRLTKALDRVGRAELATTIEGETVPITPAPSIDPDAIDPIGDSDT